MYPHFYNLTVSSVPVRCPICRKAVHRSTQEGIWSCLKLHYWIRCNLHPGHVSFWSGESDTAEDMARKCHCHRDDSNINSKLAVVEYWRREGSGPTIQYTGIYATEVIPRTLFGLLDAQSVVGYTLRTRTAADDDNTNHILKTADTYRASTFAELTRYSWELVNGLYQ